MIKKQEEILKEMEQILVALKEKVLVKRIYRGVYYMPYNYRGGKKTLKKNKKFWLALVIVFNKRYHVGCFESPEEAARAYDAAIDEMGIDCGQKNFP